MLLARRELEGGGVSLLEIELADSALTVSEYDLGGLAAVVSPDGEVEYYLSVRGEVDIQKLLRAMGTELDRDLLVLLNDDGMSRLVAALKELFGFDLDFVARYRQSLGQHGIAYREVVI